MNRLVFVTECLNVCIANEYDLDFFDRLWHEPMVMKNVGFPQGLPISRDEISVLLKEQMKSDDVFDKRLMVFLKETQEKIGEAKLGWPDEDLISEPDVKLMPEFWGHGYGKEIMKGIIQYTFKNSEASIIQTTPRITNFGSHKMIEAFGGIRVNEGVFEVPEGKESYMQPVPFYCYHLTRELFSTFFKNQSSHG